MQVTWNRQELQKKADRFEDVIRLVMHGLPWDLVKNTTRNQQQMLWEIIQRDQKDKFELENTVNSLLQKELKQEFKLYSIK